MTRVGVVSWKRWSRAEEEVEERDVKWEWCSLVKLGRKVKGHFHMMGKINFADMLDKNWHNISDFCLRNCNWRQQANWMEIVQTFAVPIRVQVRCGWQESKIRRGVTLLGRWRGMSGEHGTWRGRNWSYLWSWRVLRAISGVSGLLCADLPS